MTASTDRLFAIGDIHGCLPALETLLAAMQPQANDTVVTLGDYVDRGPCSQEVIERLLRLQTECHLVPLLGNHDQMMLLIHDGRRELYIDWLLFGGSATMTSYGIERPEDFPARARRLLAKLPIVLRVETPFLCACQLSGPSAAGPSAGGRPVVGITQKAPARSAQLGQDGRGGAIRRKKVARYWISAT